MSGSSGDGDGVVYLAHAWCPDRHRSVTVGPWHWWNVYKDPVTAEMQALRRAKSWRDHGLAEVLTVGMVDPAVGHMSGGLEAAEQRLAGYEQGRRDARASALASFREAIAGRLRDLLDEYEDDE